MSSYDIASLRQVSHDISNRTNQHVPYISMLLTDSSNTIHLEQWCRATMKFQHVTNIHIYVSSPVPEGIFEAVMQLLSQRSTKITDLHLLRAKSEFGNSGWAGIWWPSGFGKSAHIASLQPLLHLQGTLQTLVVNGVAFRDLPGQLQQLSAATASSNGGWQLHRLTIEAYWGLPWDSLEGCSSVESAVSAIADTFPALTYLNISLPEREFESVSCVGIDDDAADDDSEDSDAYGGFVSDPEEEQIWTDAEAADLKKRQTLAVGLVAAVADALAKLQELELLALYGFPDIWKPRTVPAAGNARSSRSQQQQSAVITAAAAASAAETLASQPQTSVSTAATAAAAFPTLDNLGGWLLQRLPKLKTTRIMLASAKFCAQWQRRQQEQEPPQLDKKSNRTSLATSAMQNICVTYCPALFKRPQASAIDNSSISDDQLFEHGFTSLLSQYSCRSFVDLRSSIYICELELSGLDVDQLQLVALLGTLKLLEKLEVT